MRPNYIATSTNEIWEKSICDYYEKWQFPNCIGSVDGETHDSKMSVQ